MLYKNGSSDADVTDRSYYSEKERKKKNLNLYGETPPHIPLKTKNYSRKFGLMLQLVHVSKLVF